MAGDFKIEIVFRHNSIADWLMTLQIIVPNMACSACAETITKAVQDVDPGAIVEADPQTKLVKIQTNQPESLVREAIALAGYLVE